MRVETQNRSDRSISNVDMKYNSPTEWFEKTPEKSPSVRPKRARYALTVSFVPAYNSSNIRLFRKEKLR